MTQAQDLLAGVLTMMKMELRLLTLCNLSKKRLLLQTQLKCYGRAH